MQKRGLRLLSFVLLIALVADAFCGCATYQMGHDTLFRHDIRTVHVPIFQSESLRRGLGERLTEAVAKEIGRRTPYIVVHTADADSTLQGRIVNENKHLLTESPNDDAREIETQFVVEVSWVDRQGRMLMRRNGIPIPDYHLFIGQSSRFIPEAGQSLATAQQQAIERLAREIVNQMEIWW